jgi:hypothetical protein
LTYNHIESIDSSSGLIDFSNQVSIFTVGGEIIYPSNISIFGFPIAIVPNLGSTTFLGNDRDALGFDYYFEAGLSFDADLSNKDWLVKKIRLGAEAMYGEDVSGWTILFSYQF